jgi:hypothetical protein
MSPREPRVGDDHATSGLNRAEAAGCCDHARSLFNSREKLSGDQVMPVAQSFTAGAASQ